MKKILKDDLIWGLVNMLNRAEDPEIEEVDYEEYRQEDDFIEPTPENTIRIDIPLGADLSPQEIMALIDKAVQEAIDSGRQPPEYFEFNDEE